MPRAVTPAESTTPRVARTTITAKIAPKLVPLKVKRCLEQKWWKQHRKNQVLRQTNVWRKGQNSQADSGDDKTDTVRQAKAPG